MNILKLISTITVPEGVAVTVRSPIFGQNTLVLPTTEAKVLDWDKNQTSLPFVQDFFPELDATQREFLLTGCPDDEAWSRKFPDEEEVE